MNFHVGQKVVCVDVRSSDISGHVEELKVGAIYTIAKIIPPVPLWPEDGYGVLLVEAQPLGDSPGFRASRFRPVVERKTSIEIFHRIRRSVEARETERA